MASNYMTTASVVLANITCKDIWCIKLGAIILEEKNFHQHVKNIYSTNDVVYQENTQSMFVAVHFIHKCRLTELIHCLQLLENSSLTFIFVMLNSYTGTKLMKIH